MRALVTGASGSIGSGLSRALLARGDDLCTISRSECSFDGHKGHHQVDLLQRETVSSILKEFQPEVIFHLAAQSRPQVSWEDTVGTFRANVEATVILMETVREICPQARLLIASSSAVYKPSDEAIDESHPLGPQSPYGVSKLTVEHLARLTVERHKQPIILFRPFFLIGTDDRKGFCPAIAKKLVQAEQEQLDVVTTGNLELRRDLLDVRDGVDGLIAIAQKGEIGNVYNICSGQAPRLFEIIESMRQQCSVQPELQVDPKLLRPDDEQIRLGDCSQLRSLGWSVKYPIEQTASEILNTARERYSENG